jgi:hypothetical protein
MPAQTASALLALIEHERTAWTELLAAVGHERMEQPGATGDWTFKDVVAHLMGWRRLSLIRLDAAVQNREPDAPPWPAGLSEEHDTDAINEYFFRSGRERPLEHLLDEAGQSFDRMRAAVLALPEDALYDTSRYSWLRGWPVAAVVERSFAHFHEHETPVREWLARLEKRNA